MSFGEAVTSALNKYACFTGRARRSEYWYFVLFQMIVNATLMALLNLFGARDSVVESMTGLVSLALFLPGLGLVWRRLHDIGKSGANYFWIFVPLVGGILLLVWMCRAGDHGPNRFGPDPKEPDWVASGNDRQPWEY